MRCVFALFALALCLNTAFAEEWRVRQKLSMSFEDTQELITLAIENRGLVVNYTSHIAEMLARTGADIGAGKQIFAQGEIIEFCSAQLSRQMMEAVPHNVVLCPFSISIYTLPGDKDGTWVAYRKPMGEAARIVEPLLKEIVAEAAR